MARYLHSYIGASVRPAWLARLFSRGALLPVHGVEGQDLSRGYSPRPLAAAERIGEYPGEYSCRGGRHSTGGPSSSRFLLAGNKGADLGFGAHRLVWISNV